MSPHDATATATATVDVAASADTVYGWVTDLDTMAGFAEETRSMRWTSGTSAEPGAVFTGANRNGVRRWSTTCTVTDADGRRFGFDVRYAGFVAVAHWEYLVEPAGDASCRVTESTWDRRPGWFRLPAQLATGVSARTASNEEHIRATLARIQQHA